MGKPFAAVIKLTDELKPEFDFGNDRADGTAAEVDFTGQESLGTCPKCGGRVFEAPMNYMCEKANGGARTCKFRSGKLILQQAVDRTQFQKLLAQGKTDLLPKFISRKGRPFKAYLVLKDGDVGFEFEPRAAKGKGKAPRSSEPAAPAAKIDFTGLTPVGACPKCGGKVCETPDAYLCEKSQAEKRPCRFKLGKVILQRPIEAAEAAKLLADGRSGLLDKFISKAGRPFSAYLVLGDDGKATFEFPPRESGGGSE
jgi:hypothetical protein